MIMIKTKRTYYKPQAEEGFRILVDRICPRGIKITYVQIDLWQKYISPSILLGKWFKHDESKWNEFKKNRYYQELQDKGDSIILLLEKDKKGTITLLYSSKEDKSNNAIALKEYLDAKLKHNK
jgi:uncharacterized protein YeaO (DUF488 family)